MGTNTRYYVLIVTVCAIKEMTNKLYEQANSKHLEDFNFIAIGKIIFKRPDKPVAKILVNGAKPSIQTPIPTILGDFRSVLFHNFDWND